ncbi:type II toxin-antitoxin system RelE/ParE family toxin [Testudinibacter sp. P80/BLE/0925]|uniref:type II toxin-antitoxin system RelE/ParE family toxin n=1 Tax=Testudinibacter sp. TW-1 TaxID=3417757 RepID=UPI003D35FB5A
MTIKKYSFQLSVAAKSDLIHIRRYILEKWGKLQTEQYLAEMKATMQFLVQNPNAGKERNDVGEMVFSFPYKSHMIYYIKKSTEIIIIAVLHQKMLPKNHLSSHFKF